MTWIDRLGISSSVSITALLAGLWVRRRARDCVTLSPYLATVLATDVLPVLWPQQFFNWDFYLLKEAILAVLKLGIALELTAKAFRLFPTAAATARAGLLLALTLTWFAIVAVPAGTAHYSVLAGDLLPRLLNGTIWVFVAQAAVILWYRLPVGALHKAILVGFVPYLLLFTVAMNALSGTGWRDEVRQIGGPVSAFAYIFMILYWNWVVWRLPRRTTQVQAPAAGVLPS